ncbi:MAG: antibiotic biosynthesis monooxygenase [Chloroflexi bacterium]|nr:antibiotic biosynthesis monooxygenase [Chloroflexota bacterium]
MNITRINEFRAKEAQEEALFDFLQTIIPLIQAADGCLSSQVLQGVDDATRFVVVEVWETVEAHQASTKTIPPDLLQQAMTLLAAPPSGAYFK